MLLGVNLTTVNDFNFVNDLCVLLIENPAQGVIIQFCGVTKSLDLRGRELFARSKIQ